ncbi:MAG: hypothetical protein FJ109_16810 [Deltaproteobacteria bacterium]|nr:hypothetical protein [Deltaproteobacteria bacterium]
MRANILGGLSRAAVVAVVLVAGCNGTAGLYAPGEISNEEDAKEDSGPGIQSVELGLYSLKPAADCAEVTAAWRKAAVAYMEARLEENRQQILNPEVCWYDYYYGYGYSDCALPAADVVYEGGEDEEGAKEYSTTNTQEADVDEADFMKNDGTYIYILANGMFQIVDAWPADEAHRISTTKLEGAPRSMFVHKDRAVIYTSLGGDYNFQPCTYGYDCEFTGDGKDLQIEIFDLADKTQPKLIRKTMFKGSYLSSRRVEDFVYTAVYFPEPPMPVMEYIPEEYQEYLWKCVENEGDKHDIDEDDLNEAFDALKAENIKKLDEMTMEQWLPQVTDEVLVSGKFQALASPLEQCGGYYLSQTGDGASLLSLVSFDLTGTASMAASTAVARPGAVYASKQAFYVASRHYKYEAPYWFEEMADADESTTVHKFLMAADSPKTAYAGSGLVKGRLLNQFAMSDYEGYLRVASTTGHLPGPAYNTISVLQVKDGTLVTVGLLDNLAPNEDIRSVRFGTDLGFVVTFKKTDPLFVIDLSDPTKPTVKGELKIPGFSTYMHFLDKTHLLTIGYDADDQGDFAWFQGIQLQVIDVTDITNPTLLHKEVIGTRGSSSDAATDHMAFNFFKPKEALAIPMVVCEGGEGGDHGDIMTFNGLMVYNVTVADGFKYKGGIPHAMPEPDGEYYYDNACWGWWTESNSTVKRSVFMDDWVYSVAMDEIKISALNKLDAPVASVSLE